jgi:hypothetical protein
MELLWVKVQFATCFVRGTPVWWAGSKDNLATGLGQDAFEVKFKVQHKRFAVRFSVKDIQSLLRH